MQLMYGIDNTESVAGVRHASADMGVLAKFWACDGGGFGHSLLGGSIVDAGDMGL